MWLGNGRRQVVVDALSLAERDVEAAVALILRRVRVEEAIIDRILGLTAGSVKLIGSEDDLRDMIVAWLGAERGPDDLAATRAPGQSLGERSAGRLRERAWAGDFHT